MNAKKGLFIGFLFAFLMLGFISMQRAMPEKKQERIYSAIHVYSPYKIEKRIGGLTLIDSRDGTKEKPNSADFYHRRDEVEKEWGNKHLKVVESDVLVLGDNNQTIVKIFIETEAERKFLQSFYGI